MHKDYAHCTSGPTSCSLTIVSHLQTSSNFRLYVSVSYELQNLGFQERVSRILRAPDPKCPRTSTCCIGAIGPELFIMRLN